MSALKQAQWLNHRSVCDTLKGEFSLAPGDEPGELSYTITHAMFHTVKRLTQTSSENMFSSTGKHFKGTLKKLVHN